MVGSKNRKNSNQHFDVVLVSATIKYHRLKICQYMDQETGLFLLYKWNRVGLFKWWRLWGFVEEFWGFELVLYLGILVGDWYGFSMVGTIILGSVKTNPLIDKSSI